MEVSVFRNFWDKQPVASTLEAMVEAIRSDVRTKELTIGYRQQKRDLLKNESMLFAVPCIFEGGKSNGDVVRLTGFSLVDFDHAGENEKIQKLKNEICADPHTLLCYTTISGEGLRVLFRYELDVGYELKQQMQFYRKAFMTGNAYYERLCGAKTDGQCKNVTRLTVVAHDPDVYFNPDAEAFTAAWIEGQWQATAEAEKQQKKRTRELKRIQERYEKTIRPEVEADGAVYAPGSHNDYVMRVGYKLNQYGFTKEVAISWAAQTFSDYEKAADVVRSCYEKTEEFGIKTHPRSLPLREGSAGAQGANAFASVEEIHRFLDGHIKLRHNVITGRVESASLTQMKNEEIIMKNEQWQPITDRVVNSLWAEMARTQRVNVQDIYRVIESDYVKEFQPFESYLKTHPLTPPVREGSGLRAEEIMVSDYSTSDNPTQAGGLPSLTGGVGGGSAIHQLASTVTVRGGEAEQRLWEEHLRKWLVGMVAAWMDDNVVNNVILVLIGEQGSYKTTWFNYLLPPELRRYFYTKTNANRMGRDDLLTLAQYGLICCEELDTMRPAELNQLKAAVTMPAIDERAAYAHFHEHRKHIASFCGTGNNTQFLSDPTGNRRWLPFEVESIRSPREHPFDYDGIYAEAYALYLSGFPFWFSREEIIRLNEHNRHFETPRLEMELVQEYFRVPTEGESGEFMSVANALQIVSGSISQKLSPVHMGRAFRELGFQQKVVKNVRGYVVVRYTQQEMQARRVLAAKIQ